MQRSSRIPKRLSGTYSFLVDNGLAITPSDKTAPEQDLLLIHSPEHLDRLKNSTQEDEDSPAYQKIFEHASSAAGLAVQAGELASLYGTNSFSLMRPPGHHASRDSAMGFCYINNAALAAVKMRNKIGKVAIVDIDNHHGNGTESIVSGLEDIFFVDLHKHPDYPNTGSESGKNFLNFPLIGRIKETDYLSTLDIALKKIKNYAPSLIIISAGFDTFKRDPVGSLGLGISSYQKIGRKFKEMNVPTCSLLEGGYNAEELPRCVFSYINGLK